MMDRLVKQESLERTLVFRIKCCTYSSSGKPLKFILCSRLNTVKYWSEETSLERAFFRVDVRNIWKTHKNLVKILFLFLNFFFEWKKTANRNYLKLTNVPNISGLLQIWTNIREIVRVVSEDKRLIILCTAFFILMSRFSVQAWYLTLKYIWPRCTGSSRTSWWWTRRTSTAHTFTWGKEHIKRIPILGRRLKKYFF